MLIKPDLGIMTFILNLLLITFALATLFVIKDNQRNGVYDADPSKNKIDSSEQANLDIEPAEETVEGVPSLDPRQHHL